MLKTNNSNLNLLTSGELGALQVSSFVVDLRSPGEFYLGAHPLAQNLALLDDRERAIIGTLYKQQGKLEAVQTGLEIFAQKAERFLNELDRLHTPGQKIILYCWRGGMRSQSVALWLATLGYDVALLKGGYKAYRHHVLDLINQLGQHDYLVINGKTGAGKTDFIGELAASGIPTLDLEGMARHCGSVFGELAFTEPPRTQQNFENLLAEDFSTKKHHKELVIELENSLGPVHLPPSLRRKLVTSPMVYLDRNLNERASRLVQTYSKHWNPKKTELFVEKIKELAKFFSKQEIEEMCAQIRDGKLQEAALQLLVLRYDKTYEKSLIRHEAQKLAHFNLSYEPSAAHAFFAERFLPR